MGGRVSGSGEKRLPILFSFFTSEVNPLPEGAFSEERLFESDSFFTCLYGEEGNLCRITTRKTQHMKRTVR